MRPAVVDAASQPVSNRVVFGRGTRYSNTGAAGSGFFNDRWGAFTSYSLQTATTDGPPGTGLATYVRATFTGARPAGGFHMTGNSETATPGYDNARRVQATPGEVLYISVWVRSSASVINGQLRCKFTDTAGTSWAPGADGNTRALNFSLTGGVWTRLAFRLVVPPTAAWAAIMCVADFDTGHVFDATGFMAYGTATGNPDVDYGLYMDGYTPGWRWTGAAEGSTSIGWPYTLESIAGKPAVEMLNVVGTQTANIPGIGSTEGRTLYAVTDVLTTINSTAYAWLGSNQSANLRLRVLWTAGGHYQEDIFNAANVLVGGAVNQIFSTRTIGRHVSSTVIAEGITSHASTIDGSAEASLAIPVSDQAWPSSAVYGVSTTDATVLHLLAYRGAHSLETRRRTTAWLARKYGSPIPAGY